MEVLEIAALQTDRRLLLINRYNLSQLNMKCPKYKFPKIKVVPDTGVKSCIWGLDNYLESRINESHLLLVKIKIMEAISSKDVAYFFAGKL